MVVEVEERRFARAIKVGVGADASGGRTAELLKVAASGRGVVTSSAVGAVAGCCRLNSHCSSRRCGRTPAAPPLK